MDGGSDTETDSDDSLVEPTCANELDTLQPTLSAFPPQCSDTDIFLINLDEVIQVISKLADQDMGYDFESAPVLNALQCSADTLISFVTHVPELLLERRTEVVLMAVASLVNVTLLERLFSYRKIFRNAATNMQVVHNAMVILTWVDELLARMYSVFLRMSSGSCLPEDQDGQVVQSIQNQKRDDILRAIIQLPEKWSDIHTVIGSMNFSPAAKRIATTLLFAAYVVRPQLMPVGINFWDHSTEHREILMALYFATNTLSSESQSSYRDFDPFSQRIMAAMLTVLFSTFDSKAAESSESRTSPNLRPEGFRNLLYLLQLVLAQPTDSFLPIECLDVPQIILMRWGNVVPWTWSTWNDQRIANTEHLPCLTATWLYHLHEPLFANLDLTTTVDDSFRSSLRTSLFTDIKAASFMILQLLQNTIRVLNDEKRNREDLNPLLLGLLSKLCWAIVQYAETNSLQSTSVIEARIPEYTKCLFVAYVLLEMSCTDLFVKDLIIEALTHVSSKTISSCIQDLLKDQTFRFLNRLGRATRKCVRIFTSPETRTELRRSQALILNTKALTELLIIILSTIEPEETAIQEIAAPFIDALVEILSSQDENFVLALNLRNSILMILCVSPNARSGRFDQEMWALATQHGSRNILTAGIFAQYISEPSRSFDPLLRYEAWDYLLCMMITILNHEVPKEEESLALVTSTLLCRGLQNLVNGSSPPIRHTLLSSPWTASMNTLLSDLLNNTSATTAEPFLIALRRRLACAGESLLTESSRSQGTSGPGSVRPHISSSYIPFQRSISRKRTLA